MHLHFSLIKVLMLNDSEIKSDFPDFVQTDEEEEGTEEIRSLVDAITVSTEYISAKHI